MTRAVLSRKRPRLREILFFIMMLAGWSYFLWRALGAFGPASDINDIDFNSDSAIPVLMVNDPRPITVFNFYYYCADRWGAWAFLLMQIAARIAGYRWTAGSVFAVQATWLFVGAVVFARLSRRDALVGGLAYLIALCLHRESRYRIFELSQVYPGRLRRYFWPGGACEDSTSIASNPRRTSGDGAVGAGSRRRGRFRSWRFGVLRQAVCFWRYSCVSRPSARDPEAAPRSAVAY